MPRRINFPRISKKVVTCLCEYGGGAGPIAAPVMQKHTIVTIDAAFNKTVTICTEEMLMTIHYSFGHGVHVAVQYAGPDDEVKHLMPEKHLMLMCVSLKDQRKVEKTQKIIYQTMLDFFRTDALREYVPRIYGAAN